MKRFSLVKILVLFLLIDLFLSCNIIKKDDESVKNTHKFKKNRPNKHNSDQTDDTHIIAFYNVENLFDTINDPNTDDDDFTPPGINQWTQKRYLKKINDLAFAVTKIGDKLPDVLGLAEVENKNVVHDLIHSTYLTSQNYAIIHEESPDLRGIDVALIYNKDRFNYIDHQSIPVILPSSPNAKLRNILFVRLENNSDTFLFFVNHWKSRQPNISETEIKRIETAQILRKHIDSILYLNINANLIIMGDFNDEPQSSSLYKTLYATDNLVNAKFNELYNLMSKSAFNGEGTISRDYKWFMIDNLIVSQSLIDGSDYDVMDKQGFVCKNESLLYFNSKAGFKIPNKTYGGKSYYGGFSDHLPVWFKLTKLN
jgi:endonuclease/exonuclease/phosphatase family metal-dependent hydrolase